MNLGPMNLARRPAAFSAVLLTAGALGAGVALAASGDQDPSFNGGSPAVVNFPNSYRDIVRDMAVGPAHNVSLLAGADLRERNRVQPSYGEVVVGRVASDGTAIDAFADHGFLTDPFEDMRYNSANAIAVDADDNTLVGLATGDDPAPVDTLAKWGTGDSEVDGDFTVVRYLPDGTNDGVSRVHLAGAEESTVEKVVPQADGSTLVAGQAYGGENETHVAVVRLNADGTQDTNYGVDGEATIPGAHLLGAGSQPGGPAGSIVTVAALGEDMGTGQALQLVVRRYLADGSVDETFGGTIENPLNGYYTNLKGFVGRDGRTYVINWSSASVIRFGTDGQLDEDYGTDGVLSVNDVLIPLSSDYLGADAQADGKLVITGYDATKAGKDNQAYTLVARYLPDGSGLDPEFAEGGLFPIPLPDGQDADAAYPTQLLVQDDGKIVVGGSFDRSYDYTVDRNRAIEPGETQAFVLRLGKAGTVTTPTDTTPTTGTTTDVVAPPATTTATTPAPAPVAAQSKPAPKACASRRSFSIRLRIPKGAKPLTAVVKVNGKKVKTLTGKRITAPVDLRGLAKGRFTVSITVKLSNGKSLKGARKYKTCTPKSATQTIPVL